MGVQYSTGVMTPEWKGWLEERGSLEILRSKYQDFRRLCSSRNKSTNGNGEDGFLVTAEDFRQARYNNGAIVVVLARHHCIFGVGAAPSGTARNCCTVVLRKTAPIPSTETNRKIA